MTEIEGVEPNVLDQVRKYLADRPGTLTPHRVGEALRASGRPVGDATVLAVYTQLNEEPRPPEALHYNETVKVLRNVQDYGSKGWRRVSEVVVARVSADGRYTASAAESVEYGGQHVARAIATARNLLDEIWNGIKQDASSFTIPPEDVPPWQPPDWRNDPDSDPARHTP